MLLDFNLPYVGTSLPDALGECKCCVKVGLLHVLHSVKNKEEVLAASKYSIVLLLRLRSLTKHCLYDAVLVS